MSSTGNRRYGYLLEDPQVRRWYDNIARGSRVTCEVYLRKLGWFLNEKGMTNQELLQKSPDDLFNLLLDLVSEMEKKGHAGSYIESVVKAVKAWLVFNHIELVGKIKVRGTEETPTLVDEQVPSQAELNSILNAATLRGKVAVVMVATMGCRFEVLGNFDGSDGLRVRDLPEMSVGSSARTVAFQKVPTMVSVRPSLSKAKHQYFSFLCEEGCAYLKEYLERRMREGEAVGPDSPVVVRSRVSQGERFRKNSFMSTPKISDTIKNALKRAGFKARPYVLRNYFDNRLLVAEAEHVMLRDFRVFFMGHKGDIEHRYTLNRHRLSPDLVDTMRESYRKSQRFLQTMEPVGRGDGLAVQVKKQMLLIVGYGQEELEKLDLLDMGEEQVQDLIRKKLLAAMVNNGHKQKVVRSDEVEKSMAEGWEWMGSLPDGRAVLRLPH